MTHLARKTLGVFLLIGLPLAAAAQTPAPVYISGIFRASVPGVVSKTALWVLDTDFFAANTGTIATMAKNGYTLTDLAVDTSTGHRYYSAIFSSGEPYTQYFELLPADFATKVASLAKQNIYLVSLHTLVNPQDKRRYDSGIFQAGSGSQVFSGPSDMSYQSFKSYVDTQAKSGYFLTSLATYFNDGQDRYIGAFRSGSTQDPTLYMFSGGTCAGDWNSIANQTLVNAAKGLRLAALSDDGQGNYTGSWTAGTDQFEVVAATTQDVFTQKVASLKAAGLSPARILMESAYEPPLGLAAAFHSQMDGISTGGYSYSVSENGLLTAQGGVGYARAPWDANTTPMSANTRIDIASVSKFVAGVAMYKVLEANPSLSLNTTFLSIFGHSSGQYVDLITIGNLLNMNAGITQGSCGDGAGYYDINAYMSCVLNNCTQPPDATAVGSNCQPPGPAIWSAYSDPDFGALRAVIEHITNKTYEEYLNSAIFLPLGINCSSYSATDIHNVNCHPDLVSPNLTLYYAANQTSGPGYYDQEYAGNSAITPAQSTNRSVAVCGSGGLQMTSAQAATFWNGLMHYKIINKADVTSLLNNWVINQSGAIEWSGQGYAKNGGYGVYKNQGTTTGVIVLPATDTQVAVFSNTSGNTLSGVTINSQGVIEIGLDWMYFHPTDTVYVLTENPPNQGTMCLNVSGGTIATNASVIQWGCNPAALESNDLFVKVSSLSGDGTFMLQTPNSLWGATPLCTTTSGVAFCNNSPNLTLNATNTNSIPWATTPLCLTAGTSGSILSACNGSSSQMFKLTNTNSSGASNIAVSSQCLGVDQSSNIVQQACSTTQPQLFMVQSATAK